MPNSDSSLSALTEDVSRLRVHTSSSTAARMASPQIQPMTSTSHSDLPSECDQLTLTAATTLAEPGRTSIGPEWRPVHWDVPQGRHASPDDMDENRSVSMRSTSPTDSSYSSALMNPRSQGRRSALDPQVALQMIRGAGLRRDPKGNSRFVTSAPTSMSINRVGKRRPQTDWRGKRQAPGSERPSTSGRQHGPSADETGNGEGDSTGTVVARVEEATDEEAEDAEGDTRMS